MKWIDSHTHLCDDALFFQASEVIKRAKEASIKGLVVITTSPLELERGLLLMQTYPDFLALVGSTTPHEAHLFGKDHFPIFEKAAQEGQLVALGETGLEYHHHPETKQIQLNILADYLTLAQELGLPVVIHCRDAFDDLFRVLDRFPEVRGVLHCFTGTAKEAEALIHRHWFISISGILTFKNSLVLQETVRSIPLEYLLIETDAPYLAPQSKRGKVNEPCFLPEICQKIADLKGLFSDSVASILQENTKRLFTRANFL